MYATTIRFYHTKLVFFFSDTHGRVVAENELEPMLQGLILHMDSRHKPVRDVALSEVSEAMLPS